MLAMPTFEQLLGKDRELPGEEVPAWIRREVAVGILANAHGYLKACENVLGREERNALLLLHGTILEIQEEGERNKPFDPLFEEK